MADTSLVLWMPFLTLSTALAKGELVWRTYTAADTLLVAVAIPTGSLLPRVRYVQPWGADIQVFIRLSPHLNAQDELINGLIN